MKASELRIGNSIYQNEDLVFVTTWRLKLIEDKSLDYKSIPLTEEWLLKFGFKNNRLGLFDCVKVGDDIGYHIYFIGKHLKEVQYVHQLQNLYFALTGYELEIKDEVY